MHLLVLCHLLPEPQQALVPFQAFIDRRAIAVEVQRLLIHLSAGRPWAASHAASDRLEVLSR